jgi:enolase-phosphatase E1
MLAFRGRGILLDIEGTTSSIRYVYDVLFPFARRELGGFLQRRWDDPAVRRACDLIAREAGATGPDAWGSDDREQAQAKVSAEAIQLMDGDVKATGLKELQGLIWEEGFQAGTLRAHVYPDVPPALRRWASQGLDLRIFSSGSVAAQRVFFANTEAGDLLGLFRGHYDTTTGPKRSPQSYQSIVQGMALRAGLVLFLSDVTPELDAAASAGLQTALVVRPGNAPAPEGHGFPIVTSFDQVEPEA